MRLRRAASAACQPPDPTETVRRDAPAAGGSCATSRRPRRSSLVVRRFAGLRSPPAANRQPRDDLTMTDFEVGQLLSSAVESSGTSGLVSG